MRSDWTLFFNGIRLPVGIKPDLLSDTVFSIGGFLSLCIFHLLLFFIGAVFSFYLLGSDRKTAAYRAGIISLLGLFLFPVAEFLGFGIAFLPLLLAMFLLLESQRAARSKIRGWFGLLILSAFASPIQPLLVLAAGTTAFILRREQMIGYATGAAVVLSLLFLPEPVFSGYPEGARLTAFSPFNLLPGPFIGPELAPNPIRFEKLQEFLRYELIVLAVVVSILLWICKKERDVIISVGSGALLLLSLELLFAPSPWTPFRFLLQILPGLALAPIPSIVSGVLILAAAMVVTVRNDQKIAIIALFLIGLTVRQGVALLVDADSSIATPVLQTARDDFGISREVSGELIDQFGDWIFSVKAQHRIATVQPILVRNVVARAHPNQGAATKAFDGDLSTRWRTARAQQQGDTFELFLEKNEQVSGVHLILGDYVSDYPRGLRIEVGYDGSSYTRVFDSPDWRGELRFTKDGAPYFGPQEEVKVIFPAPIELRSIRFTQTGVDPVYDWAISEVVLLGDTKEISQ